MEIVFHLNRIKKLSFFYKIKNSPKILMFTYFTEFHIIKKFKEDSDFC